MDLSEITVLVLTADEAANISRCVDRLYWASRVVVVDSGSSDGTLALLAGFGNTEVVERPFDDHVSQWNYGLGLIRTPWVLTLDADYVLSEALVRELESLTPDSEGYEARFRYCVGGRPLRGSLYPPRVVLFRVERGAYIADGHTQALVLDGTVGKLSNVIDHDDRKSLSRWLESQQRYARLEAEKLRALDRSTLGLADRIRVRGWAPFLMPLYCLVVKGLILDGSAGLRYTMERTYAELLLALHLHAAPVVSGSSAGRD